MVVRSRFQQRPIATIIAAGIAAGLVALQAVDAHAQTQGVPALVVKAAKGCFSSMVRATGLVVARTEAVVSFNAAGYQISEILVMEGDQVAAGQVLAQLTRLGGDGPQGGPGGTGAGAGAAGGAQAGQEPPATMPLRAPAGGLVSASTAKIGLVGSAIPMPPPFGPEPLFRIIVGNELEMEGDVSSRQLPQLNPGQPARVQLGNGREVMSRVRMVFPEIDRKTQLGKVRLILDPDPAIRAGMFATATIDASRSCGVSIPRSAVQYRTEGATAQVVKDGVVETRRIRVGFSLGPLLEVRQGIGEGEVVIANAGTSLHDGDHVRPMFADESSEAGAR